MENEENVLTIENGVVKKCKKDAVSVIIPVGVTKIGQWAFSGCHALESLTIPSSVTKIDWYSFFGCDSLKTVTLADDLEKFSAEGLSDIPDNCKIVCTKDSLAYKAVKRKRALRSHIEEFAIEDAKTEKIKQVQQVEVDSYLEARLENVEASSFEIIAAKKDSTDVLVSIGCNNGVFRLGKDFSKWSAKIESVIKIFSDKNKSAEEIYSETLKAKIALGEITAERAEKGLQLKVDEKKNLNLFCKGSLKNVIAHDIKDAKVFGITKLDKWAFDDCSLLKSVKIPDEVTKFSLRSFARCRSLSSITVPSGVSEIDPLVFWGCTALSKILFAGTVSQWNEIKKAEDWNEGCPAKVVKCSDGEVEL